MSTLEIHSAIIVCRWCKLAGRGMWQDSADFHWFSPVIPRQCNLLWFNLMVDKILLFAVFYQKKGQCYSAVYHVSLRYDCGYYLISTDNKIYHPPYPESDAFSEMICEHSSPWPLQSSLILSLPQILLLVQELHYLQVLCVRPPFYILQSCSSHLLFPLAMATRKNVFNVNSFKSALFKGLYGSLLNICMTNITSRCEQQIHHR